MEFLLSSRPDVLKQTQTTNWYKTEADGEALLQVAYAGMLDSVALKLPLATVLQQHP